MHFVRYLQSFVVLLIVIQRSWSQACHPTCLTCSAGDSSDIACTSCDPGYSRSQSTGPGACQCDVGYIDDADPSSNPGCISGACSYTCPSTCQSTSTACTSCDPAKHRIDNPGGPCLCDVGYYDDGSNQLCGTCDTKCSECTTASSQCTSCYTLTQFRQLNVASCDCIGGYYDDGTDICAPCHYSCATCSTGSICDSCDALQFRVKDNINGQCRCKSRYYQTAVGVALCEVCDYTCLTCTGSTGTDCTNCNSDSYRTLVGTQCKCLTGYYPTASVELCSTCHITCLTCSGPADNQCLTCDPSRHRTTLSGTNTCPCDDGYFANTDTSNICVSCHSSCQTCSSASTCTACPFASQIINPTNGICQCSTTSVWNSGTSNCDPCDVRCATCSVLTTNCTSCDSTTNFRSISGNACPCMTGYYDNNVAVCVACGHTCLTCDSSGCLTCNVASRRTKSGTACLCNAGFYDDGSNMLCKSCDPKCLTCLTSSTNCQSCDGGTKYRDLVGSSCPCLSGYYDSGLINGVCYKCSHKCGTCTSSYSACDTCAGTGTRPSTPGCACAAKYYDDSSSADCQPCNYRCKTCINAISCSTCDSTKHRTADPTTGYCKCTLRYYDDTTNQLCLACDPTCLTCTGGTNAQCSSCNATAHRVHLANNTCACVDKFYETASTTQMCATCHATCLTCNGATITSCLTCSSTQHRVFDGTNTCLCIDTYYLYSTTFQCRPCHSSCARCTNSSKCVTCPSATQTISSSTGTCICPNNTAYDSGSSSCTSCNFRCTTCSISATNCTSCDNATNHRIRVGTTCSCAAKYYDNNVAVCVACASYKCDSCDSSGCLTCNADKHRYLSGVTCLCESGYYDDGTGELCMSCHYTCESCSASNTCDSCNGLQYRQPNGATNLCSCLSKYYEDTNSLTCQPCLYHCATCQVPNRCATCDLPTNHRTLNQLSTLCQCQIGYYDDSTNQLCQACPSDCLTCSSASTCLSCDLSTKYRELDISSRCACVVGYYQDTGVTPHVCQLCHYSCQTCSNAGRSACSSCNALSYRQLSGSECVCQSGYYDDTSNELCVACKYSCLTCVDGSTCDGCDTASTGRSLSTNQCVCDTTHYYDDGTSAICQSCNYSCLTCTSSNSCASCDATKYRQTDTISHYCKCMAAYYDDLTSAQLCQPCSYQCLTCVDTLSCLTCDLINNHRQSPTQMCLCIDGYYDDGTSNAVCQPCQYTCKTCTNDTQCLDCNGIKYRSYDAVSKLCICMDGYYDTGSNNEICDACHYSCLTCSTASTHCLTCQPTSMRTLDTSTNTCDCNIQFYDDIANPSRVCQSCHYTCKTCTDASTCTLCDSTKHREYDPNTDLCRCMVGYFDNNTNSQMCQQCQGTCLQCTNLTACSDCDRAKLRLLNTTANYANVVSPFCSCQYKHYPQPNPSLICLPCHYTCGQCSSGTSTTCLYCSPDAHRHFQSGKCPCDNGYFDNGTNVQTCLACHEWCSKCTNATTTTCTACNNPYYLKVDVTTCYDVCPSYFYGKTSTMTCQACQAHCITCVSPTNCSLCDPGWPLYKFKCVNPCPAQSTFTDVGNNKCIDCPVACLTCNSLIYCTSCIPDYYLDEQLHLCFPCHINCKGCFGPAQNQCLDCNYPLYLNNSQCFNISCPYGQYIDSHLGCLNCKDLFSNSLTCTIDKATLCQKLYKVNNGICQYCTNVPGFAITSTNDCSQVCGDGLLIEYQCDDGNNYDGDGCSSNCIIEQGWHCLPDASSKSVCALDGAAEMVVKRVFKYGGENKVKLYIQLSIPIKLNKRFFLLVIVGLKSQSSISWQFTQSQSNLRNLQFIISYQQPIQNKQVQLSYDTTRRRLLQSVTLTFDTAFTLNSYPPANYYDQQRIDQLKNIKNIIYYACIVLLCLCAFNLIFVRKMYVHVWSFVCVPAQLYILYGLGLQNYTDWIKWSLKDIRMMAFIGGFDVGNNALTYTDFLQQSVSITANAGIVLCIMLALWVLYAIISILNKYIFKQASLLIKLRMYGRYAIITLQLCLLPHMTYSAVNALYNSSLTSQNYAINVCLAIFVNVCNAAFVAALFAITADLKPKQLMIQYEESQRDSLHENISSEANQLTRKRKDNIRESMMERASIISRQTDKSGIQIESSRSEADLHQIKSRKLFPQLKIQGSQQDRTQNIQINLNGIAGYQNRQLQIYKKIQDKYQHQWLIYDFVQLYAAGGSIAKVHAEEDEQQLEQKLSKQSSKTIIQQYKHTKFYLPLAALKIYLFSLVISVAQAQPFIMYLIIIGFNLVFIAYVLTVRPFSFSYTNLRVLCMEFFYIAMSGLIAFYSYQAINSKSYDQNIQQIMMALMATTAVVSIFFLCFETIGAWRRQIWKKIQQCLIALRLRGARKVMGYKKRRPKTEQIQQDQPEVKKQEKQQPMDAFFSRMLKKEAIEKQYRRQRLMVEPKFVPRN